MRLEQLRYFIDVADTGSINSTAKKFFATQQSINAALKRLEEDIGYTLLERSTSGVRLTKEGKIFLEYAVQTVEGYHNVLDRLAKLDNVSDTVMEGELHIASASVLGDIAFPKILNGFRNNYPQVNIKIAKVPNEDVISLIRQEKFDLGLLTANFRYVQRAMERCEALEGKTILEDQLVVCMKSTSRFSGQKELDQQIMSELTFSIYSYIVSQKYKKATYNNAMHVSDDAEFHKRLIEQDLCVTLMPKFAYEYLFKSKRFTSAFIKGTKTISHCYIMKKNKKNKLLTTFIDYVEEYIRNNY